VDEISYIRLPFKLELARLGIAIARALGEGRGFETLLRGLGSIPFLLQPRLPHARISARPVGRL
jgi:hypothetical protein